MAMSYEAMSGGNYGQVNSAGQGIPLAPNVLRAEIISPILRLLLSQSGTLPSDQTTSGLLNWASSQGRSNRAITPTVPGLQLPAQIQQILQQPTLAQIARSLGGPAVDPNAPVNTNQFPTSPTSGGQVAQAPTSTAPASSSTPSTPLTVDQIVAKAVQAVLSQPTSAQSESGSGTGGGAGGGGAGGGGGIGGPGTEIGTGSGGAP